jgi:hypothetical protein
MRRPYLRALTAVAVLAVFGVGFSASAGASAPRLAAGPAGMVRPLGTVAPSRSGAPPALLQYWGGGVMRTNTTYAIFWLPSGSGLAFGSSSAAYEQSVGQFLTDVGHDSGSKSNVFSLDTQYYDTLSGGITNIAYNSTFGGSAVVTDPLPASQCSDSTDKFCVTDAQLQAEIRNVVGAKGWPQDTSHAYFIFTPTGLGSCISASSSSCSYSSFCAYHGAFSNGGASTIVYGNQPYLYGHSGCDAGQYPNGGQADPTINVFSHEFNEAITDPVPNYGWADAGGSEIGDKCAWTFGTFSGSKGAEYNQTINGHHYFLQEEFDNASDSCLLGVSPPSAPAPVLSSFSPASAKDGAQVTIGGSGFTGATAVAFHGMSAAFSVASDTQIKATVPAGATSGTISVTTPGGTIASSSSFFVLPTVSSFSPAKAKVGASVVLTGSGFTGATTVTFNKTATRSFTVTADGKITVTVPSGATSGTISVTTPSGTGTSAASFSVG